MNSGNYEDAIRTLLTLKPSRDQHNETEAQKERRRALLPKTLDTCKRLQITLDDIDGLSIIHVTGTKGKSSTCAFVESILRKHGYKTGLLCSPHLVEVRERIWINGQPLGRDQFSTYFWHCYNLLQATKDSHDGKMPNFYRFLTVMAFHVFLQEKVDVAIIEAGKGGEYDTTNIIRSPVVCGVTSLDVDHVKDLGDTIEKVAWHKGGIFKPGVPAVTVPQPDNALNVLHDRAHERCCPLYVAPPGLDGYNEGDMSNLQLGISGETQTINASLALQLCNVWQENHNKSIEERKAMYISHQNRELERNDYIITAKSLQITEKMRQGLEQCHWSGRYQKISRPGISYFLDISHTELSMRKCAKWFLDQSKGESKEKSGKVARVLMFNRTDHRKPQILLQPLMGCDFHCAIFCTNTVSPTHPNSPDQTTDLSADAELTLSQENQKSWQDLQRVSASSPHQPPRAIVVKTVLEALHLIGQGRDTSLPPLDCSLEALDVLQEADHIQMLCTGSSRLVGALLGVLNENNK